MRIGLWIDEERPLNEVVERVRRAAELGYAKAWIGQRFSWDPLALIAAVAPQVPGIGFGTAIVNTWTHHPLTLAAQALTAQAASQNRFTLGVGPSHQAIVEAAFGQTWDRPALRVREVLEVLRPLLGGEAVDVTGETVSAHGALLTPGVTRPPLLLSAHGPRLLRLAGELADGVITTWTTSAGLAQNIVRPVLEASGGEERAVVVGVPVVLTNDPAGAKEHVATVFARAQDLPTYARSMARDGITSLGETVLAGDEAAVEKGLREYVDAGATEIQVTLIGPADTYEPTLQFLGSLTTS